MSLSIDFLAFCFRRGHVFWDIRDKRRYLAREDGLNTIFYITGVVGVNELQIRKAKQFSIAHKR